MLGITPRSRRVATALAAVAAVSLASSCGGADSGSGSDAKTPTKKGLTVAFLPKQVTNNDYFTTADNGGKKALGSLGSTYKEVGTDSGSDIAGQVSHVDALAEEKVDAIAVSAQDPDALCTALKQAMRDGISVVTYDSDTNKDCRQIFVSPASAEDIGRSQIGLLMQQLGSEEGEIAILSAAQTASNQNLWIDYMKDELSKYLDIKIVEVAYGDDDPKKSLEQTRSLLRKHPNLKAIISPTTVGIKSAAQYLSQSEYKGKVKLTGLGTPNEMRPYIKDGTVESFILWDPAEVGALAAHAAVALESGQITGAEGDDFVADGPDGRDYFVVGADGVVSPGEPVIFSKKNIDDFDF